jgi:hypothetical protein
MRRYGERNEPQHECPNASPGDLMRRSALPFPSLRRRVTHPRPGLRGRSGRSFRASFLLTRKRDCTVSYLSEGRETLIGERRCRDRGLHRELLPPFRRQGHAAHRWGSSGPSWRCSRSWPFRVVGLLLEAADGDTAFRDLYLQRAAAQLAEVMPERQYRASSGAPACSRPPAEDEWHSAGWRATRSGRSSPRTRDPGLGRHGRREEGR